MAESHIANSTMRAAGRALLILFAVLMIASLLGAAVARAEDDEREDYGEQEDQEDHYEREDERDDEDGWEDDDDSRWEFDDDFYDDPYIIEEEPIIAPAVNSTVNGSMLNSTVNTTLLRQTIIVPDETPIDYAVDLTPYMDDDGDGVANKDDTHPGKDDLAQRDTDGDGFNDRADLFPGKNDRDYMDEDRDGVIDSKDSDTNKATDKDHDGVDDKFDDKDDRSALAKILGWLGIVD